MLDQVDAFALVELSFDIEQVLVQRFALADLVYQKEVFFVFAEVEEQADIVAALGGVHLLLDSFLYLDLNAGRAVELALMLRELLHCYLPACRNLLAEPHQGNASFSEETKFFEPSWTSVAVSRLLLVTQSHHFFFRLWCWTNRSFFRKCPLIKHCLLLAIDIVFGVNVFS